ncbi:hypothetical protein T03_2909 [Trichinella britovi]|uniref:Uncharacterized protein n=4 Tax=Trichinella TaxID=6333 RepID=A0A0V1CA92_TRIBR|nr:hypothetical protein T03_2909 [Trichinella britovi]
MLSRDKTENNFGVAFFCTEHIHFCSFFGKLHIVLGHMIGGSARTKSGVLLVSVTVALGGFLRMASRAINGWLHEGAVAYSGISNSTRSLYSSLRQFFYIVVRTHCISLSPVSYPLRRPVSTRQAAANGRMRGGLLGSFPHVHLCRSLLWSPDFWTVCHGSLSIFWKIGTKMARL